MTQQSLFGEALETIARNASDFNTRELAKATLAANRFDGKTFEPALDQARLNRQLRLVLDVMKDGRWRTLQELSLITNQPEASVSARLRDLRKKQFGAWKVDRLRVPGFKGLWEYRVRKP